MHKIKMFSILVYINCARAWSPQRRDEKAV